MTPLVSVVVPAWRCEKTVADSVRSALSGRMRDIEVLIVDDGSDDATKQALKALSEEDARVRVITLPQNSGVANARNIGARASRARWIAFLDSDDCWLPDKLERQLAEAARTGSVFLYCAATCIDADGKPTGRRFNVPERIAYRDALYGNDIVCSTVLIDRALFLRHPMERSDLHEDYLCWLAVLKDGIEATGVTDPLILYRVSAGSKSGNKLRSASMAWRTYRHLGFGFFRRLRCFLGYCLHGIKRYWL